MSPLLYEIDESIENEVRRAVENDGGSLRRQGALIKTLQDEQQYWAIVCDGQEILCFDIIVETTGRRLLMMGPRRKSAQIRLYDTVLGALERGGAKRLQKLDNR